MSLAAGRPSTGGCEGGAVPGGFRLGLAGVFHLDITCPFPHGHPDFPILFRGYQVRGAARTRLALRSPRATILVATPSWVTNATGDRPAPSMSYWSSSATRAATPWEPRPDWFCRGQSAYSSRPGQETEHRTEDLPDPAPPTPSATWPATRRVGGCVRHLSGAGGSRGSSRTTERPGPLAGWPVPSREPFVKALSGRLNDPTIHSAWTALQDDRGDGEVKGIVTRFQGLSPDDKVAAFAGIAAAMAQSTRVVRSGLSMRVDLYDGHDDDCCGCGWRCDRRATCRPTPRSCS